MKHRAEPTIACASDPASERTLVVAAKNGDELAFETLFKRYQRKTLAVVLRYTRVVEDAEDVVQQSFYKAFVHLCQFQGESSFSTWLTRIAINEALMFLRRMGAVREVSLDDIRDAQGSEVSLEIPDSNADPETRCLQREEVRILSKAVRNLRPELRTTIALSELRELSTSETARRMGLSVAAVKTRIFRGKRKLRQELASYLKPTRKPGTDIPQPRLCNASGL
ncbi:MAG TPA: sigma-70 family RNA polymerase sigma factor [Candidatus Dormibacteraeota bacterium]|jgi:RNA polymerase sigma-70 factor (ECF subfamily)|nr:sigma-70 family RNA polymerase sigma factor [Candidatus Dormibacteraeota bacterium]